MAYKLMPIDSEVVGSLAYRKNTDAIWRGQVPEKYTRILPYVKGKYVLEIGAAEGVLALLMADAGHKVMAFEKREDRYLEGMRLKAHWKSLGRKVDDCIMVQADAAAAGYEAALAGADILVAVRVVYHLAEKAPWVMRMAHRCGIARILLCGNKNRAANYLSHGDKAGEWNFYSSIHGMTELLTKAGYEIETIVKDGDPIVVGRHPTVNPV